MNANTSPQHGQDGNFVYDKPAGGKMVASGNHAALPLPATDQQPSGGDHFPAGINGRESTSQRQQKSSRQSACHSSVDLPKPATSLPGQRLLPGFDLPEFAGGQTTNQASESVPPNTTSANTKEGNKPATLNTAFLNGIVGVALPQATTEPARSAGEANHLMPIISRSAGAIPAPEKEGHTGTATSVSATTVSPPPATGTLLGLQPHHLADLRRSGLSDETIRAAGIYSEVDAINLAVILNRKPQFIKRSHLVPAIVFPFVCADGRNGYRRAKPDTPRLDSNKKPIKYESPVEHPNEPYLPPGVAEVLADATRELLVTEGEKKALAATQVGFPCIGLVGVYGWKERNRESLLSSLENVAWHSRPVYVIFDDDVADNEQVQNAESRLAAQLINRGAKVRVVRLPHGPPGDDGKPTKMGLDDFLVAHNIGELRQVLDNAEEPRKLSAAETKLDAKALDAADTGAKFLGSTIKDGVSRLRFWRDTFYFWQKGAYREFPNTETRAKLITFLNQSYRRLTIPAINNVLDQLKAQSILPSKIEPPVWIAEKPDSWPADEILACRNGLVHLPSLVAGAEEYMQPPTPTYFATSALDCDFQLDVQAPSAWLQFLNQLWPNDPASIGTLQEWFGYCLRQDTRLQKILLLIGPKRSGKGTIARVLRALIGIDNVCGPSLASLATQFGLWPLLGKSLAIIGDARLSSHTDSAIVVERLLSISGEDAITIDRKNLPLVTCKLPTRLMIISNELPRVNDTSGALVPRLG